MLARVYFYLCRTLGRLLRASTYAEVHIVARDSAPEVRKQRRFYAPLLVRLGRPLVRILDTGVTVLPQRDWIERERLMHSRLYDMSVRIDNDGVLILPHLPGQTLATLLDDPQLSDAGRSDALGLAVAALAELHRAGFTHGDAMAENVMIDVAAGVARWFDFETVHDTHRALAWRRADDVRALLATSLLRTDPARFDTTVHWILDAYADEEVARMLATRFTTVWQRPLTFHLGQAGLSYRDYSDIARVLSARVRG